MIKEPYDKLLAEVLRLESKLGDPATPLRLSASGQEYVSKNSAARSGV